MNVLITFGGAPYDEQTQKIVDRAPRMGADKVWVYDDMWMIETEFYRHNYWLWEHHHKRGFGWYAWKPFIILDALSRLADNDIVMYVDADCYPVKEFGYLYVECAVAGGALLFRANGHKNYKWTKRDAYIVMGQDEPRYHDRELNAGVARFMLFQKGPWRPYQFLMEWLTYCINPRATTFDPSVLGAEDEGFIEHRTEQAIMSLLAYKYGYPLHPELDYEQGIFCQENTRPAATRQETSEVRGSRYRNVEY
jgi:hypothetical protein